MSNKMKEIDGTLLHRQLVDLVEEDRLYNIRNDAKIRAVCTAKTYDEFRDIVAAAHLQPLKKTDKDKKEPGTYNWNKALKN